jgi:OOP family OmpA-OmpF porin
MIPSAAKVEVRVLHRFSLVVLCFLWITSTASAQRGFDVDRFRPALDADGFLGIQATRTPGPARYDFQLWLDWMVDPLVVIEGDESTSVIDHRVTPHLQFQVGIGGRLAVGFDAPFVLYQDVSEDALGDGLGDAPAGAAGNPRLLARYRFYGEDSEVDRDRPDGAGLALQLGVELPLGERDTFAAETGTVLEPTVIADFHIFGAGVAASLGGRFRLNGPEPILDAELGHELELGIGLKVPLVFVANLAAIVEIRWIASLSDQFGFSGPENYFGGDLGFRYEAGDFTIGAGVGKGFTDGVGSPLLRSFLTLTWSPRVHDADGDEIPDARDQCEFLPEDFDEFEDGDGCLDPDNDNDLIPDPDDRCPNEEAEEFRDEDEDGCTDPFADGDSDRVADADDSCPVQAEDLDEFQDQDGCPEPDNDGDTILDGQDQCPGEAETANGVTDEDGCPEADRDSDAVLDEADRCADQAEDRDQFEDDDGCPEIDNDRDGVLDEADRCANELETINGVTDDDGCRDRGGRARWRLRAPAEGRMSLEGQVGFAPNGTLTPDGIDALEQLVLHARAQASLSEIHVPAGTDAAVAERAGNAIKEHLESRGIAPGRMTVHVDAERRSGNVILVPPVGVTPIL